MIDTSRGFTIERTFRADPRRVWDAWTVADEAARWWHPRGTSTPRDSVSIDAQIGGRYAYTMVDDETGESVRTGGVYRELSPDRRLVFTWGDPDVGPDDDAPVVTVTIAPEGSGSRMRFDLRGVDGHPGDEFYHDGWDEALDCLGEHLDGAPADA
ncbi:hypothetical protein GCM10025865_25240 [Paraoerskovia sediminicola]|uniref:Activator of Hsp90 ATPase homologue 1/2-like C-terminal domain-containing protein n=1 Tax=Paraoerskovia sediminicola TaxID=1138587 RepID=A0ABN6XES7_9CELL|nr:SRPBCC domain-containing protein [Paraoerskovia sediminicola]BDZ43225.1 hypothetical protein GCM10025865_25240 [Paraoerskovia sediminicola]